MRQIAAITVDERSARPIALRLRLDGFPSSRAHAVPGAKTRAAASSPGDLVRVDVCSASGGPDPLHVELSVLHGGAPVGGRAGASGGDLLNVEMRVGAQPGADPLTVNLSVCGCGSAPSRPAKAAAARAPTVKPSPAAPAAVSADAGPTQQRLEVVAAAMGLTALKWKSVPSDYYEQSLEWRRDVLGAPSVDMLCKSIIMENTRLEVPPGEEKKAWLGGRVKYALIVVQYVAKLHKEKLHDAVRSLEGSSAVGKKQYNFRLVDGALSDQLSGFGHNAVTPLGLATADMPVVAHDAISRLPSKTFWLGGGEVDLKVRFPVDEFKRAFKPKFADICGGS